MNKCIVTHTVHMTLYNIMHTHTNLAYEAIPCSACAYAQLKVMGISHASYIIHSDIITIIYIILYHNSNYYFNISNTTYVCVQ